MARTRPATALLEHVPDGVVVTDARGTIVFANRSAARMTGYRRRELVGRPVELLVPQALRAVHRRHRRAFHVHPSTARPMGKADEDFRLRRKDGSEIFVDIALGSAGGVDGLQTIAVIRDMTERRRLEAALEHEALHDPLTGIANRTLLFDRLNQAVLSARRERKEVALVMLDLDSFKEVNDSYGHASGDALLVEVGARMTSGLRATDTAGRLGGDEFAWVFPRVAGHHAVERIVHKLIRRLEQPFQIGRRRIEVGVSAGAALYPQDGKDVDTLMRHADAAMYAAKRAGRYLGFFSTGSPT